VQLVFLYGPPGVGKYTIGVELAAQTGFRLFHNHLTVNLVSAVFERNSDVWLRVLRRIRRDMLTDAARQGVNLIMTSVFNGTSENVEAWRTMLEQVEAEGGSVLFVQLTCDREELFRRVEQESRRALDKLVDAVRLSELLDRFEMFSPAPFGRHLCLDVTHLAPSDSATMIIQHYGIGRVCTTPSEMVRSAVAHALGRPALDNEITIRAAAPHQSNRLYDVHVQGIHLITKEYTRADRPDAPRHEYEALRRLKSLQLAPEPVFFGPTLGPVVVYQFMEGDMWDRRVPSATELRPLAELWRRFHCLDTDGLWLATGQATPWRDIEARLRAPIEAYARRADRRSSQFRDAARLSLEALDRSLAAAAQLIPIDTPPLCFCRSDARFANVIARPDSRLGLVDWEDGGLRDPAREVADLLMHPNQEDLLDWEAWQPFLSVYTESRQDDPDFEWRLQGYLAVFPVFWLGILLADGMRRIGDGNFDTWLINDMEPNTRLRRYLARTRAWPDPDPTAVLPELGDVAFF
jgi:thiamine kinase-like enzyme/shikimate kinase